MAQRPCDICGTTEETVRLIAVARREGQKDAYLCPDCAREEVRLEALYGECEED